MEINDLESFDTEIIKKIQQDHAEGTTKIENVETAKESDYNSGIILIFSSLILFGLILTIYQFNILQNKYDAQIALFSQNIVRIESKLEKTAQISLELNSLRQTSENQTAIFDRALGKLVPLIIPENYQKKLSNIKENSKLASIPETLSGLETLETEYKKYISTTPPWIQEEQKQDLLSIRYALQFFKIKLLYEDEVSSPEETERILTAIYNEKPATIGKEFEKQYTKLIETVRTDIIENDMLARRQEAEELVSKVSKIIADQESIVIEELESLIAQLESYQGEFTEVQKSISDARVALEKAFVDNSVKTLEAQFAVAKSNFKTTDWDHQLSVDLLEALEQLRSLSPEADRLHTELSHLIVRQNFSSSVVEVENRFLNIEKLSEKMQLQLLPILNTELANLMLEIESAPYNVDEEKGDAETLLSKFENRLLEIEGQMISKNEKIFAAYNKWALESIDRSRERFSEAKDQTGLWKDKAQYRNKLVGIFDELLVIDTTLLYDPVRTLYHEVYASIMGDLEPENKYQVAQEAIWTSKKTIDKFMAEKN